jgi:hypothetical protein
MSEDKVTPCCYAETDTVQLSCSSEWCGETVTERWTEIRCLECGSPYEMGELLDEDEVEEAA